ncbi:MAG: zeta toxin family protein [Tannerellaceae bacterium]|jgi:hypothetical protein|nr:zeta toxin family protein [Tannerellaceae bacterium]
MQRADVEQIFEQEKERFFNKISPSEKPLAVILGGQPACGKSTLLKVVEKDHIDKSFLSVNGDLYRIFHPKYSELIKEANKYSAETQIFSNVFTEKLIEEAINRRCNIVVEGTMRNPDIPLKTANLFRNAGYSVEAYAISAPNLITQLGVYIRFQEEVAKKGVGRMAEMNVHHAAVDGLPKSLDTLYEQKAVEKISLYTYLAKEKIKDFNLENDSWDCESFPSLFINDSRNRQLHDRELLKTSIEKGEKIIHSIKDNEVKKSMNEIILKLKTNFL